MDQNPFESILAQMKAPQQNGLPQGGMPQGQMPQQGSAAQQAMSQGMGQEMAQPQDVTQPGVNPGGTKQLLSALQMLHQFIGQATDPTDIAAVRGLIQILTRLVARDQEKQMREMGQAPQGGMSSGPVMGATGQAAQMSSSGPNQGGV